MVKTEKKYDLEASLSTATVILILFLLLWFIRLAVPDPPLNERAGGGDGGYGLELAYAPVASEPSISPNTQPEPEETPVKETTETVEETPTEDPVISDNNSEEVIKVADKKIEKKGRKERTEKKETEKAPETTTNTTSKKKNNNIKEDDLFNDGDDKGGGDPNGNGKEGTGGDGGNKGPGNGGDGSGIGVKSKGFSNWNYSPPKNKTSNTTGEIEFEVEIDDKGIVKNVTKKRSTVSIEIVNAYIQDIFKMKFIKNSDGTISNTSTKGTLTYSFKAR